MDDRRKSIFKRINTYRGASNSDCISSGTSSSGKKDPPPSAPPSQKASAPGKKGKGSPPVKAGLSQADIIKRRMELWRKIEEEAMKMEEKEASSTRGDKIDKVSRNESQFESSIGRDIFVDITVTCVSAHEC